ncbi:MAG: hypothetical protein WCO57_12020 [Verrucomicrobiota bacterium]
MSSRPSTPTPLVLFALLAVLTPVPAEIDSGGGNSSGGTLNNHSSIGAAFATVTTQGGSTLNHPGLIEALYPVATAAADSDANGLPDAWEILHFGHIQCARWRLRAMAGTHRRWRRSKPKTEGAGGAVCAESRCS